MCKRERLFIAYCYYSSQCLNLIKGLLKANKFIMCKCSAVSLETFLYNCFMMNHIHFKKCVVRSLYKLVEMFVLTFIYVILWGGKPKDYSSFSDINPY